MGKKQDWEDLGDAIAHAVDDAVSVQDYSALNETIHKIIDNAVDSGGDALKNVLNGAFVGGGQTRSGGGSRTARPSETERFVSAQKEREEEKKKRKALEKLYGDLNEKFMSGGAKGIIGGALLFRGVMRLVTGGIFSTGGLIFGGMLALIGGSLLYKGIESIQKIRRFRAYQEVLGSRFYCSVEDMARKVGKTQAFVVRDLQEMISEDWFPQGHLDAQGSTFMLSDEVYEEYRDISRQRAIYQEENRGKEAPRQAEPVKEQKKASSGAPEKMDPRVKEILEKGQSYLARLRECNEAIPGDVISAKISRMEELVQRILDRARSHPEIGPELKKMMNYYLPTTVKLLEAYQELDSQPVAGENITKAKKEIEDTLDTLNLAFERLLDSIFQDTAWDVSSDISVLQTMLAQEGLTGSDFAPASGAGATATATATATADEKEEKKITLTL